MSSQENGVSSAASSVKGAGGAGDRMRREQFKSRSKGLERGTSAPLLSPTGGDVKFKAPLPLSLKETVTVGHGQGHEFVKKTFFQPTFCHHCTEMLWGLKGQGMKCMVCNFVSHEKCVPNLKVSCRHIAAAKITDPVSHQWTEPKSYHRKKWCNVCRKRIHAKGVICEVCKVYSHVLCKANAFNNCKNCATYNNGVKHELRHHWIEGNLSSSARCVVCTKNCSTENSLSGFRCGWCGFNVHSACIEKLEEREANERECTYRDLWHMVLVPRAVTHRLSMKSHVDQEREGETTDASPQSPTTVLADVGEEEEEEEDEYGSKGRPVIIIDGSNGQQTSFKKWRNMTVHPTHIGKKVTAHELLIVSLRKCGISDPPTNYYLAEIIDSAKNERELKPTEFPYDLKQNVGFGPLKLYIRARSSESGCVKGVLQINNGQLESQISQVSVSVTNTTPASEIVAKALISFDLAEEDSINYCLVELSQVEGVRERILKDCDCPWKSLQDLRKQSLTFSNLQRYFLRHREGGVTSIYMCNIDKDILKEKEKYTKFLKNLFSEIPAQTRPSECQLDTIKIGPAFPSAGGLFLEFPTFDLAILITSALEQLPSCPKFILLPTIHPDAVGFDQEPLLVFVNGKSGGNQGVKLLSGFRRHLNPHQIYDLMNGGPLPGLYAFRHMPRFRIMIGGGDGTFGWVLSALQEIRGYLTCSSPPSAVLPLGTGNDLARALNWGGGYTGEKLMQLLLAIEDANNTSLDRWNLSWEADPILLPSNRSSSPSDQSSSAILTSPQSVVMNNYCGIGLDAAIALDFHLAREENPEKFNSRFHNKGVYFQLGLQKMVTKSDSSNLQKHVRLTVDGKKIDLPDLEGIVFLNIRSWGAGKDPWGTAADQVFTPPAMNDGKLEVVGISGAFHMGQIQGGIRSGIRLAQGEKISLEVKKILPFQVDGEAGLQPPGVVTISCLPNKAVMLSGGDKLFSRQLSKKETVKALNVSRQLSDTNVVATAVLSSRRQRMSACSPMSPSDHHHTLEERPTEEESVATAHES